MEINTTAVLRRTEFESRKKQIFFCPSEPSDSPSHPLNLLFKWYRSSLTEVTRPEPEVDLSPPSGAEVKNQRIPVCLHGVDRTNLPFYGLR